MKTFLVNHSVNVVLTDDGEIASAQLYVTVRDEYEDGHYFDHVRTFELTGFKEIERTTRRGGPPPSGWPNRHA